MSPGLPPAGRSGDRRPTGLGAPGYPAGAGRSGDRRRAGLGHPADDGRPGAFEKASGFLLVDLDRFQGPLDLLLHLIRQQDIDIFDIPIATITDQFLAAVGQIQAGDLDGAGEFLEMAATLIRIKAQMLLPRYDEEEEEDPRAELVRRLLEYEQIREISSRLSRAEAERARRFPKGYLEFRPRGFVEDTPLESTWEEVLDAAGGMEATHPRGRPHRITTGQVALEAKVQLILEALENSDRVEFSKLLAPWKDKMHGVITLLAGLELSRQRALTLRQARLFSELWLLRGDPVEWARFRAELANGAAADRRESQLDAWEWAGVDRAASGPERQPETAGSDEEGGG